MLNLRSTTFAFNQILYLLCGCVMFDTKLLLPCLFLSLMVPCLRAQQFFSLVRFSVVGCLLNSFFVFPFQTLIAFSQLTNHVLNLWYCFAEVFGTVSSVISTQLLLKFDIESCTGWGFWLNFLLQRVWRDLQFALFFLKKCYLGVVGCMSVLEEVIMGKWSFLQRSF